MPATVINGLFSISGSSGLLWLTAVEPGIYDGFIPIPNTTNITQTYTGATIAGPNAGDFAVNLGQFPVVVNPGQTALIHATFTPRHNAASNATLTIGTATAFAPFVPLGGIGTIGTHYAEPFPPAGAGSSLVFPTTKVGLSTTFANVRIINTSRAIQTVTNIAMAAGTDFFLVGAPVVPFTIPVDGETAEFSIQFSPIAVGSRFDTMTLTVTGASSDLLNVQGTGSVLQSAFNLTGATVGSLFAFPGTIGAQVLLMDPTNLNSEEPGKFIKLHDFAMPNLEKQLMRVRGHYEDLGPATILVTVICKRQGKPNETIQVPVSIGTGAADSWIREFTSEPCPITGELIQLTVSRAAGSGPVSIIDYMPEIEPKGEVIGGT